MINKKLKIKKKIAVIGSGFFGTTISLILSKKFDIDLYEKEKSILRGASLANQLRFHFGYHYPRSRKTVKIISKSNKSFLKYYGYDILGKTKNFYGVTSLNTKTTFLRYLSFLKKNKLFFKITNTKEFSHLINGQILTKEKNLNYFLIKKKIQKLIKKSNINLLLNTQFKKKYISSYDKIILCTYSQNNFLLKNLVGGEAGKILRKMKYELVEKIVIKLPKFYENKSYVVLDGEFACVDPYLGTNYHLLSDVKFSKLEIVKGFYPNFRNYKKKYLNKKLIKNIRISHFKYFIKNSSKYLPFLKKSKYIGSFYVIRTLPFNKEKTDERLNYLQEYNKKIITVFSGKWNTAVNVAHRLLKYIQ